MIRLQTDPLHWYSRAADILRTEAATALAAGKTDLSERLLSRAAALEVDAAVLRKACAVLEDATKAA